MNLFLIKVSLEREGTLEWRWAGNRGWGLRLFLWVGMPSGDGPSGTCTGSQRTHPWTLGWKLSSGLQLFRVVPQRLSQGSAQWPEDSKVSFKPDKRVWELKCQLTLSPEKNLEHFLVAPSVLFISLLFFFFLPELDLPGGMWAFSSGTHWLSCPQQMGS